MLAVRYRRRARTAVKSGLRMSAAGTLISAGFALQAIAAPSIQSIEVSGNRRIDAATVRFQVGLRAGDSCSPGALNAALKAAFATGQFADVRVECRGSVLRVAVVENPVVGKVSYQGRSAIEEKDLVKAAALAAKEVYSRAKGEAAVQRLRALYRARGHEDAQIEITATTQADNRVDVTFGIKEGAVVKVEQIAFSGNRAFSQSQLRDVITTRQSNWFDFLRQPTPPEEDRLSLDRSLLTQHYLKHGYSDVVVGDPQTARAPKAADGSGGGWQVTFPIDEGERYAVGTVTVSSKLDGVAAEGLREHVSIHTGDVYNPDALDKSVDRMTAALIDAGHPSAEVRVKPRRDPAGRTVGLELIVAEGPRIVIDRIEITGNSWTRDNVIRRELNFTEGDIYNPLMVDMAKKRLKRLGLFKSVEIRRGTAGKLDKTARPDNDRIVLVIEIVEKENREVGFGIGYSDTEGIIGDVSLGDRNLFGRGQDVKLKLAGSQKSAQAMLSFTEPRFLGTRIAAGFDLFYKDTDLTSTSSYKSTRYGGSVRFGTEIGPNLTSTFSYSLTRTTIYDVGADASQVVKLAIPGYPSASTASYNTSAIGNVLAYDTRDSKANPMSGVLITSGQDLAGVGGDVRYLRTTVDARAYIPVAERITLATRAGGGTIGGWGGSEVKLLDNFFRGGDLVRGFAPSGIGPRDVLSARQDALGGTNYITTTAELRFSVPTLTDQFGLRPTVFADAGSLFGATAATKAIPGVVGTTAALRASVGVGLIWDSPVGPLQAGYAIPVAKQAFDKTQNLTFGLGSGL